MYCSRCGKQIDYDAIVCRECVAAEANKAASVAEPAPQPTYQQPAYQQQAPQQQAYQQPVYQQPAYQQQAPQQPVYQQTYQQPAARGGSNPRMYGFGGALASAILSMFAFIFCMIVSGEMAYVDSYYYYFDEIYALVYTFFTWGVAIPSVALGAASIKRFCEAKRKGQPAPIPTLILGISGLALSSLMLFISFIYFIVIAQIL